MPSREEYRSEQGTDAYFFVMGIQTQLSEWVQIDAIKLGSQVYQQVKSFKKLK